MSMYRSGLRWPVAGALVVGLLAGCAGNGPFGDELLGYRGLNREIREFYDRHAWERQATCPTPELQAILRAEVVGDRGDEVVLRVRYAWRDPGSNDDDIVGFFPGGVGCDGIDERLFTVAVTGDRARVVDMSGLRRPPTTQPGRPAG